MISKIRRIPAVLRRHQSSENHYDPQIVSLGPLHHGNPHLFFGEDLKGHILQVFLSRCREDNDRGFFYSKILDQIDEIRRCYDGVTKADFDDAALAEMMLLDGCFAVMYMEGLTNPDGEDAVDILRHTGIAGFSVAHSDMLLFENQIPFRVLSVLITLKYGQEKGQDLIDKFVTVSAFEGSPEAPLAETLEDEGEPLHLLEAVRRKLVSKLTRWSKKKPLMESTKIKIKPANLKSSYSSHSVTELKAKGIYFRPSPTYCLRDVEYDSSNILHSELRLPVRFISANSKGLFSNLIAYEICPNSMTDFAISSYVNLMKSLIHSVSDVRELRNNKILISTLGSDQDVLEVFRELQTYGTEIAGIFGHVKEKIEEHCNSKFKTYMQELIHTYFESPWSIALLAGILLLALMYLRNY